MLAIDSIFKGAEPSGPGRQCDLPGLGAPRGLVPEAGDQPGPWMPELNGLLDRSGSAVPATLTVRVRCGWSLQSSRSGAQGI